MFRTLYTSNILINYNISNNILFYIYLYCISITHLILLIHRLNQLMNNFIVQNKKL